MAGPWKRDDSPFDFSAGGLFDSTADRRRTLRATIKHPDSRLQRRVLEIHHVGPESIVEYFRYSTLAGNRAREIDEIFGIS